MTGIVGAGVPVFAAETPGPLPPTDEIEVPVVRLTSYDGWGNEVARRSPTRSARTTTATSSVPSSAAASEEPRSEGDRRDSRHQLTWGDLGSQTVTYGPTIDIDQISVRRRPDTFPVVLEPFSSQKVAEVRYIIESKDNSGVWSTVGMATATQD